MNPITQNLIIFMERVSLTGKEAIAWCQAYSYLQEELAKSQAPTPVEAPPAPEIE